MRHLILGVTSNCNLACSYCEQRHAPNYMSIDVMTRAIDYFASTLPSGTTRIQISFYGGEPLLCKNIIREAVKYSKAKFTGIRILYEITTNGLLLDDEFIDFASQNNIVIALSHDGMSQGFTRGFTSEVDSALDKLAMAFDDFPIMLTIHPSHVGLLSDSIRFLVERRATFINLTPASGSKVYWDDDAFETLREQMELVTELYIRGNQNGSRLKLLPLENKIKSYINELDNVNNHCQLCSSKLLVNYDGKIYPCTHFIGRDEFVVGDLMRVGGKLLDGATRDDSVRSSSQASVINYEKLLQIEKSRMTPSECDSCSYSSRCSHRCACANHGFTGSLSEPSPFQCEYERLMIRLADKAASILIKEDNPTYLTEIYK